MSALLLLKASCGDPSGETSSLTGELECKRENYPCAGADVSPEVAREGIRLGEEALDRFAEDGPEAALAWLRERPGTAHAVGDDVALRFRLEGGRPVWVLTAGALGHAPVAPSSNREGTGHPSAARSSSASGAAASFAGALAPRFPAALAGVLALAPALSTGLATTRSIPSPVWAEVAGRDRNQDGKVNNRDVRRALILDPFHWEWSRLTSYRYSEGIEVTRILEATRGYEEGVVRYLRDQEAGAQAFTGWDSYDVVHFTGHGHRICEYDGCFSMIFTGDTVPSDGAFDDSSLDFGRETGIMEVRDPESGELMRRRHVALGADWFAQHYRGVTLDRTLLFLSGCGTADPGRGFVPDFLEPLLGAAGTTTIGWTDTVPGQPAQEAALYFYRQMTEHGLRAGDVLRRLEREGLAAAVNTGGRTARLRSGSRGGSDFRHAKLRIREVVSLQTPGGRLLTDGVAPRDVTRNSSAGDGRPDTLHVKILVDGVQPEERDRWSVALELDGRTLRRDIRLSPRHQVGEHLYRVDVPELALGEDLQSEQDYELEAVASLPEGGESRYSARLKVTPFSWTLTVSGGPAPGTYRGDRAVASIDRAGRITSVGLYTGTDVRPDVWVGVVSSVHGESVWAPADDAGYEPGVPARRGTFEVILNYGDPERVHLDVDSFKAERIGLSTVWPHYPPMVEIRRVTEETVEGFAEGAFSEQKTLDQAGTMRVEFRARACRVGDPDFSACTSLQPVSW